VQASVSTSRLPKGLREGPGSEGRAGQSAAPVAAGGAAQVVDQPGAGAFTVQQQRGIPAASAGIGLQQGAQPLALVRRPGVGERHGAAGAHRAAGAAAHAQVRVDHHAATLPRRRAGCRCAGHRAAVLAGALALQAGVAADGAGRAHVDAGGAAGLLVAAVGAQALAVLEEARLLEIPHPLAQVQHGGHQPALVAAGMDVALRRLVLGEVRLRPQIEHQVEGLADGERFALEVDGAGRFADTHAVTVALAQRQVDLVAEVDRTFGAGVDAGIAAGAQVQVDRVRCRPAGLEPAQVAGQTAELAAVHRMLVLLGQRTAGLGQQQADLQLVGQQRGGALGRIGGADHQAAAGAVVADGADRLGIGQLRSGDQRGQLGRGLRGIP
jgi:hypothetical protein